MHSFDAYAVIVENDSFGADSQLGTQVRIEVVDMIRSGWTPNRIVKHLYHTLGVDVPVEHVTELRDAIPKALLLPPSELASLLNDVDLQIDVLGDLGRLIALNRDRLARQIQAEKTNEACFESVDDIMEGTAKLLAQYSKLQMDLGLLPQQMPEMRLHLESATPTVEEILKTYGVQRPRPGFDSGEAAD